MPPNGHPLNMSLLRLFDIADTANVSKLLLTCNITKLDSDNQRSSTPIMSTESKSDCYIGCPHLYLCMLNVAKCKELIAILNK